MRLRIGYPDRQSEREIVRSVSVPAAQTTLTAVLTSTDVSRFQEQVLHVRVDDALVDYMLAIVEKTRAYESLTLGVSPRGAQALYRASQALAMIEGRDYVIPDDIKRLVVPVFAHRVVINARVAMTTRSTEVAERILTDILTLVDVPL
jgi:MoxR-like ATPase